MSRAAKFLVAQPRFSFNWFVAFDEGIDDSQKITVRSVIALSAISFVFIVPVLVVCLFRSLRRETRI